MNSINVTIHNGGDSVTMYRKSANVHNQAMARASLASFPGCFNFLASRPLKGFQIHHWTLFPMCLPSIFYCTQPDPPGLCTQY